MKIILFDLDGTLTDSAPGIVTSVAYALEKMGRPVESIMDLKSFIGPPLKPQFMSYAGFTEEEAALAVKYYREYYTDKGMFDNAVYDGIELILQQLKESGCILAVASSKPEEYVRQILEHYHLSGYFTEIVGAQLNETRTTKEEVIEEALKRLDAASNRMDVIMVGDRSYDIIGARNCGVSSIGAGYGYGSMEELVKAGATFVAEEVSDLAILIPRQESLKKNEPEVETKSIDIREEEEHRFRLLRKKKQKEAKEKADAAPVKESMPGRIWRCLYPILVHLGIATLVVTIAGIGIGYVAGMLELDPLMAYQRMSVSQGLWLTGLTSLMSIPVLASFYGGDLTRREEGRFIVAYKPGRRHVGPVVVLGALMAAVGLCQVLNALVSMVKLTEMFPSFTNTFTSLYDGHSVWEILVVVGLVVPAAEELVFRGLMQLRIRDYMGPVPAIVISAVIFGIYHGNLVQFIYATLLGLFLGAVMERSHTILLPMGCHMAANAWSVLGPLLMNKLVSKTAHIEPVVNALMALLILVGIFMTFFMEEMKARQIQAGTHVPEVTLDSAESDKKE